MRERQTFGGGQDLDSAGGDAPVAHVGGGVRDRDVSPGQGVDRVEQRPPVLLHGEDELAAALADEARGGLHGVQRVGRHDLAVQVDIAQAEWTLSWNHGQHQQTHGVKEAAKT